MKNELSAMASQDLNVTLHNRKDMPMIGIGTYRITGTNLIFSVLDAALKAGYRSIDTAAVYNNEKDIGIALQTLLPKYHLRRKDIFLTSKLGPSDHGKDKVTSAVHRSLTNLQIQYLDLYLIHWPGVQGLSVDSLNNSRIRAETWKELTVLHNKGTLSAIGVSNYTADHLAELLDNCYGVKPAVNQVEFHPHYHQPKLLNLCREHGVLLQAYCSLGGSSDHQLLQDPIVGEVARRLGRTPAMILLRWALQQGVGVIPKSVTPERIAANIDLEFTIPECDMKLLSNLPRVEKYAWDPSSVV